MKRIIVVALLSLVACGNPSTPTDITVTDVPDLDHGSGLDTVSGDVTDTDRIVPDTAIDAPADVSPVDVVQDDVAGDVLFDVGQDVQGDDSVTTDEGTVEDDEGIPTDVKTDITQDVCIPTTEECDGEDNDCDGLMDEADSIGCSVYYEDRDKDGFGVGSGKCLCSTTGYYTGSVNGDCDDTDKAANPDKSEICNNTDDDCDGQTDEDLVQDCTVTNDAGTCRGTETCAAGGWFGCTAIVPGFDTDCDGIDDDCNGPTDDGWEEYGTDCSVQECIRTGVMTCVKGHEVDTCVPVELSEDNDCDNFDDDCDGETDEHYQSHEVTCDFDACEDTGMTSCTEGIETDTCTYRFRGTAFEGNVCDEPVNVGLMIPEPTGDQKYQTRYTSRGATTRRFHTVESSKSGDHSFKDLLSECYGTNLWGCTRTYVKDEEFIVDLHTWTSATPISSYIYVALDKATETLPDEFEGVIEIFERGSEGWELRYQKVLNEKNTFECGAKGAIPILEMKASDPVNTIRDIETCDCWMGVCSW